MRTGPERNEGAHQPSDLTQGPPPPGPKPAPDPLRDGSATAPRWGKTDTEDGPEDGAGEVPVRELVYTADTGGRARPPEGAQGLTPVDGVVLANGTVPVLDGIAVLGTEPRTPAAFELPPAGYDPYMFRIER